MHKIIKKKKDMAQDLELQLQQALEELTQKEQDLIKAAEFGQLLLQSNMQLQAQLDAAGGQSEKSNAGDDGSLRVRMRETEKAAERQIQALTRQNQTLQQDLRTALQDQRRAEHDHAKEVTALETDLDALRTELERAAKASTVNARAQKAAAADEAAAANADEDIISDLQKEVAALATFKKEADKKIKETTLALQEALLRIQDQQDRLDAAASMRQEFERRGTLIIELKEQVEDLHVRLADAQDAAGVSAAPEPTSKAAGIVSKYGDKDWEWTPWLESVKGKVWERNLTGLREEVDELRKNREEAYSKLKEEMDTMVVKFVDQLPESVRLGIDRVGNTISGVVLPAINGIFVPSQLTGEKKSASDDTNIETIIAMFPNIPRSDIEKDLAASGSARLTIENILNGFVKGNGEESGLNLQVANPEE
ncbi:hypothetical protein BJ741DRAFT_708793 [Chytriomyces cf. hyalinus JEL632]|nr:hypothetical protein BJ741DRAFT_708793 [Chytriomyces cf. hyalinus JEL632]